MQVRKSRRRRGFTLMEVLLVLAILVVLASGAVIGYQAIQRGALQKAALSQIKVYETASDAYQLDCGQFPATLQDLVEPSPEVPEGKWKGPYIKGKIQRDPWNHEYNYIVDQDAGGNDVVKIRSAGPNGVEGDADDVANLE